MPTLLDLFCGIGGAAVGYERAGFDEIIGVDNVAQPQYPFKFIRSDAITFLNDGGIDEIEFDAVHASPPCKKFSVISKTLGYRSHTDLLTPTAEWFEDHFGMIGAMKDYVGARGKGQHVPWIIENVISAPMRNHSIMLCGSMFDLRIERGYLQRHRLFESNIRLIVPGPCKHGQQAIGVYGNGRGGGPMRERTANGQEAKDLMGIHWAGRNGVVQAVPPAYTTYL